MITVLIDLSSQLKTKAITTIDSIELQSPCSVQDCVRMVADDCGEDFAGFLFSEDGALRPTILLSVNDAQIFWDDHYLLSDGDRVSILSPIAGGQFLRTGDGLLRQIIPLNDEEKQTYEWQMWVPDVGEEGQEKLKASTVLISRCGGLGGVVAYELAAAGVGKLLIAHGGNVKHSDLNRQLLMTHDWLGKPRVESAKRRLNELNPHIEIETTPENINETNAEELVSKVDIIADCAPLFEERFLMNQESVKQNKPMVESAMYELEAQITTVIPGSSPCLACVYPEKPPYWKRQFPVFGAVSGTVGCIAAMEVIKLITGIGSTLSGKLLTFNLRDMSFKTLNIRRNLQCNICRSHQIK